MKIVLSTDAFSKVLQKALCAVDDKGLMPAAKYFRLIFEPGELMEQGSMQVLTKAEMVEFNYKTKVDYADEKADVYVDAYWLYNIVKNAKASKVKEITLTVKEEQVEIKINSGKYKTPIEQFDAEVGHSPIEYPKEKLTFKLSQSSFIRMINKVRPFAAGNKDVRDVLKGVSIQIKNDELRITASDNVRLISVMEKVVVDNTESFNFVINANDVKRLTAFIEDAPDKTMNITVGGIGAIFDFDDYQVMIRLMRGEFPNFWKLLPEEPEYKAMISKSALMAGLSRACVIDKHSFFGKGLSILFDEEDKIKLVMDEKACGMSESIATNTVAVDKKIVVDPQLFMTVIDAVLTDNVRLEIKNDSPIILINNVGPASCEQVLFIISKE